MVLDLDLLTVILLFVFGFLGAFINAIVGGEGLITLPALMFVGLPPELKTVCMIKKLVKLLTFFLYKKRN